MAGFSSKRLKFVIFAALAGTGGLRALHAQIAVAADSSSQAIALASLPAAPMQTAMPAENIAPPILTAEVQGDLAMYHGSYAAAIDAYRKAWPRTAALWNKTGTAYHHLYALDEAMKDYQMALSLDPQNTEALNNLGAVYHAKHEFAQAERSYELALKFRPDQAVTYCNLGTTYFAEHNYRKGIKAYERALAIDANVFNPKFHPVVEEGTTREAKIATAYNMAKVFATMGRNQDALASLRTAVSGGFRDRKHLSTDKEFSSLRELPEFHSLMVQGHMD